MMKKMKFECTLLSDVVLNQKAATEGKNSTLDFIPGNVFLGIVASQYDFFGNDAIEVFHSNHVRFGDAHPVCQGINTRTLHVPASFFYPKMKNERESCYIFHFYNRQNDKLNNGGPQQLKQCRNGFYAFSDGKGIGIRPEKSFSIKSAYDRDLRKSKDEQMYGYESLRKGLKLWFEVEMDDDRFAEQIKNALLGEHGVGRSRTAQYGRVLITEANYHDVPTRSTAITLPNDKHTYMTVYADGRLIFIDAMGKPMFQPSAKDLGIDNGEIRWDLSQVRTFQYAPWNGKRQTRDADRCGIEKGSVFVVEIDGAIPQLSSRYIGFYQNEGFGKVIYNPDFLDSKGNNGHVLYKLVSFAKSSPSTVLPLEGSPLLRYIKIRKQQSEIDTYIYKKVNEFVDENKSIFLNARFAAQWGTIRTLSMQYRGYQSIMTELFDKTGYRNGKSVMLGYLCHGVAEEQWKKYGRRDALKKFIEDDIYSQKEQYGDIVCRALVNLSSEMAKQCKK